MEGNSNANLQDTFGTPAASTSSGATDTVRSAASNVADTAQGALSTVKDKASDLSDRVATGMQAGADWLREADFGKLRDGLEQQVKERPGRTLLIALGVGYLLGKAIRR